MTGIYFLFKKGKLIYIGQSTNLSSRISQHILKEYDFVRFIQCDEKNLTHYEYRWIDRFHHNGMFRPLKIVRGEQVECKKRIFKPKNKSVMNVKEQRSLYMSVANWDKVEVKAKKEKRSTNFILEELVEKSL